MLEMQTVSCTRDYWEMNLNLHNKNTDANLIQLNERRMKTKILLARPE